MFFEHVPNLFFEYEDYICWIWKQVLQVVDGYRVLNFVTNKQLSYSNVDCVLDHVCLRLATSQKNFSRHQAKWKVLFPPCIDIRRINTLQKKTSPFQSKVFQSVLAISFFNDPFKWSHFIINEQNRINISDPKSSSGAVRFLL